MILTLRPRLAVCCAALAITLAACSSTPTEESEVWDVTPGAGLIADASLTTANSGYIQVTRDNGTFGSACTTSIIVANRVAARLRPQERVTIRVPVGEHKLGAEIVGICPGFKIEQSVLVTPNGTTRLRIRYGELPGSFAIIPIE